MGDFHLIIRLSISKINSPSNLYFSNRFFCWLSIQKINRSYATKPIRHITGISTMSHVCRERHVIDKILAKFLCLKKKKEESGQKGWRGEVPPNKVEGSHSDLPSTHGVEGYRVPSTPLQRLPPPSPSREDLCDPLTKWVDWRPLLQRGVRKGGSLHDLRPLSGEGGRGGTSPPPPLPIVFFFFPL